MTLYSLILVTHIATAISLIAMVLYSDHYAAGWIFGKYQTLSAKKLRKIHMVIYIGLGVMLVTGIFMFLPVKDYLLSEPAFKVKMAFVFTLLLNSMFIEKCIRTATEKTFASLSKKERVFLCTSGAISMLCWTGTIVAATQLGL